MLKKLLSRKLWMAVLVCVAAIVLGSQGNLPWDVVMKIVLGAAGGYLGIEGLADMIRAANGKTPQEKKAEK